MEQKQLSEKIVSIFSPMANPYNLPPNGDVERIRIPYFTQNMEQSPFDYQEEIRQCRYFYRYDPLASVVINRMCEIGVTDIINRRNGASDEAIYFFNAVADRLSPILEMIALEYFVAGAAAPDYTTDKIMGRKLNSRLGRKRYTFPKSFWVRNPENIIYRRKPLSIERGVYLQISEDERYFIENKGKYRDGTTDYPLYRSVAEDFPEYVQMVLNGVSEIPLPSVKPVLRKPLPTQDYPQPFLVPALSALKHKQRIKRMDYNIATKAVESFLLVNVGNDQFPITEDSTVLEDLKDQMNNRDSRFMDIIYRLFTNHTVKATWVYPPLDALLSEDKYNAPNADILSAFGFSKVLLQGENEKSNAGNSNNSTVGPLSTLSELRRVLLRWVRHVYEDLAELNDFTDIPVPYFRPVNGGDLNSLASFALSAVEKRAISRDLVARMLGSDFDTELEQIQYEERVDPAPEPVIQQTVTDEV